MHVSWSQEPVKTDICESKSVSVHVEAVIASPLPMIVYQTPGADGLEAEPQLGSWVSTVAPSEVDPDKSIPAPGVGRAPSQKSLLPTICSSNSGVVEPEENTVDVTSNRYSIPLTGVHSTVEDEEEKPS